MICLRQERMDRYGGLGIIHKQSWQQIHYAHNNSGVDGFVINVHIKGLNKPDIYTISVSISKLLNSIYTKMKYLHTLKSIMLNCKRRSLMHITVTGEMIKVVGKIWSLHKIYTIKCWFTHKNTYTLQSLKLYWPVICNTWT